MSLVKFTVGNPVAREVAERLGNATTYAKISLNADAPVVATAELKGSLLDAGIAITKLKTLQGAPTEQIAGNVATSVELAEAGVKAIDDLLAKGPIDHRPSEHQTAVTLATKNFDDAVKALDDKVR